MATIGTIIADMLERGISYEASKGSHARAQVLRLALIRVLAQYPH